MVPETNVPPDLLDMATRWQQADTVTRQWADYRRQMEDLILAHHWVRAQLESQSPVEIGPLRISSELEPDMPTEELLQQIRHLVEHAPRRPRFNQT